MHIDFALPVAGDLEAGFKEWQRKAERAVMDYSFHMGVTTWNDKVGCTRPRWHLLHTCCSPLIWPHVDACRTGC